MKEYYECHITMWAPDPYEIAPIVEKTGWSFSVISGDPDLGSGIKAYATRQFNKRKLKENVILNMNTTAEFIKEFSGAVVLRQKVELVIYDERAK